MPEIPSPIVAISLCTRRTRLVKQIDSNLSLHKLFYWIYLCVHFEDNYTYMRFFKVKLSYIEKIHVSLIIVKNS